MSDLKVQPWAVGWPGVKPVYVLPLGIDAAYGFTLRQAEWRLPLRDRRISVRYAWGDLGREGAFEYDLDTSAPWRRIWWFDDVPESVRQELADRIMVGLLESLAS